MLDKIRDKNRYLIVGFTFFTYLLITVPSGLAAWLSLVDRFSREGNAFVLMSNLAWYPIGLLILGLAIVTVGIWWIRAKYEVKGTEATPEVTTMSEPIRDRLGDMVEEELNNLTELPTEIDRQLFVKGTEATPEVTTMSEPIRDRLGDMVEEELNNLTELPTEIDTQSFPPTFLDVSTADLVDIYKGRTTAQAKPLVDVYVGNMIHIRGSVVDIRESSNGRQHIVSLREEPSDILGPSISAYFDKELAEELQFLSINQSISVLGKIDEIDRWGGIRLESCLLLSDVSAADLVGIYKGRTTAQAKPLVDVYVGNMIHIRGSVVDIRESSSGRQHIVSLREEPSDILGPSISAYFDKELAEELQFLSINQSISVLGKIDEIDRWGGIRLESCLLARGLDWGGPHS